MKVCVLILLVVSISMLSCYSHSTCTYNFDSCSYCNSNTYTCYHNSSCCTSSSDCNSGYYCSYYSCVRNSSYCTSSSNCSSGYYCSSSHSCVYNSSSSYDCYSNSDCGSGYYCSSYSCVYSGSGSSSGSSSYGYVNLVLDSSAVGAYIGMIGIPILVVVGGIVGLVLGVKRCRKNFNSGNKNPHTNNAIESNQEKQLFENDTQKATASPPVNTNPASHVMINADPSSTPGYVNPNSQVPIVNVNPSIPTTGSAPPVQPI